MKSIHPEINRRLFDDNRDLEWIGKKKPYDIIDEVAGILVKLGILISALRVVPPFGYAITSLSSLDYGEAMSVMSAWGNVEWGFLALLVGIFAVFALGDIAGIWKWSRTVYVVASDPDSEASGTLYEFTGALHLETNPVPITKSSPNDSTPDKVSLQLWNWFTGDDMIELLIFTPDHKGISGPFMTASRVSREFSRALGRVRGHKPVKVSQSGDMAVIQALLRLLSAGVFSKDEVRFGAIQALYGDMEG